MNRKEVMVKKLGVLEVVKKNKEVLFASSNANITNQVKQQVWKEVLDKAQSLDLASADKTWTYARDSLFGLWKCRTLRKWDKANRTGSAGGKEQKLDKIDRAILDILEKKSPKVCADPLGSIDNSEDGAIGTSLPRSEEPPQLPPEILSCGASTTNKRPKTTKGQANARDIDSLKEKLLKHSIYVMKLKALKLERQMGLPRSRFTSTLIDESSDDSMEDEEDPNDLIDLT